MAVTDALDRLTIGELDAGSRLLKTDLVSAISEHTMHKWAGLAIVAFLLAKRTDPTSQLATYRAMTPDELADALGLNTPDPEAAEVEAPEVEAPEVEAPPAPTPPASVPPPAMDTAALAEAARTREAQLRAAVGSDPTAPSPVSSSPARGAPTL